MSLVNIRVQIVGSDTNDTIGKNSNDTEPGNGCQVCTSNFSAEDVSVVFTCCHASSHAECLNRWLGEIRQAQSGDPATSWPRCLRCRAPFDPHAFHTAMTEMAVRNVSLSRETQPNSVRVLAVNVINDHQLVHDYHDAERARLRREFEERRKEFKEIEERLQRQDRAKKAAEHARAVEKRLSAQQSQEAATSPVRTSSRISGPTKPDQTNKNTERVTQDDTSMVNSTDQPITGHTTIPPSDDTSSSRALPHKSSSKPRINIHPASNTTPSSVLRQPPRHLRQSSEAAPKDVSTTDTLQEATPSQAQPQYLRASRTVATDWARQMQSSRYFRHQVGQGRRLGEEDANAAPKPEAGEDTQEDPSRSDQ